MSVLAYWHNQQWRERGPKTVGRSLLKMERKEKNVCPPLFPAIFIQIYIKAYY